VERPEPRRSTDTIRPTRKPTPQNTAIDTVSTLRTKNRKPLNTTTKRKNLYSSLTWTILIVNWFDSCRTNDPLKLEKDRISDPDTPILKRRTYNRVN